MGCVASVGVRGHDDTTGNVDGRGAEADVVCVQSGFFDRHGNSRFEGYVAIAGATADRACEQCSQSVTIRPSVHGPESSKAADRFCLVGRSEEHTSELQSLMRISYAVFCLKKTTHPIGIYHQSSTHILH